MFLVSEAIIANLIRGTKREDVQAHAAVELLRQIIDLSPET